MSSVATAWSSLMSTISKTADMVTNTVNVASDGVTMLNSYVSDAKEKQNISSKIAKRDYLNHLIEDTAKANTERKEKITQYLQGNEIRTKIYQQEFEELHALFATPNPA